MFNHSRIFALGGFLLIAACGDPMGLVLDACYAGCGSNSGSGSGSGFPPGPYTLSPDSVHILLGDTLTFRTWQCQDSCFTEAGINSRWSIDGDAAAAGLSASALTRTVASSPWVLVHGVNVGRSTIRARAIRDTTETKTAVVYVADSSVITELRLKTLGDVNKLGPRGRLSIYAELRDGAGTVFYTQPAEWSLSDTTVAQFTVEQVPGMRPRRVVEARSAGTTEVTARFLHLTARFQVTVIP